MKHVLTIAVIFFGFLISVPSSGLARGPADEGQGPSPERMERHREMRGRLLREKVGLSDEKVVQVQAILDDFRSKQRALKGEMRVQKESIRALLEADSEDQAAYRDALDSIQSIGKQMSALKEGRFEGLGEVLTPKEQAQVMGAIHRARRHMRRARGAYGAEGRRGMRGYEGSRAYGEESDGNR